MPAAEKAFFTDLKIENANSLAPGEYDKCQFCNCSLMKADLSDFTFLDCSFENCDLSLAKVTGTSFQNAKFNRCKLLGLHFERCKPFLLSLQFTDCNVNLSSFYKLRLQDSKWLNSTFHEADFTEADLSRSRFDGCDFYAAIFDHSILQEADLRQAFHYTFDPDINRIHKARFSAPEVLGLLSKYDIEIS